MKKPTSNFLVYVDCRLKEWACCYARELELGLGYPKRTVEARLIDEGGLLINSTASRYQVKQDQSDEIEDLISELARQNPKLGEALREYYCGQGTVKQKANRLNVSYAHFRVCVDMGQQWIAGSLTAIQQRRKRAYM